MRTKHITMGILAHVDAGKTTLSEAVLYLAGAIRKIGRVDHKNAFLDTDEIERERGITVFSKEARFETGGKEFTLLDTPGHTDFSSETERTLQVLDYAVLVVSGADGVQAHTVTLWKLFRHYGIPVFVFVNKMDRPCAERQDIIRELSEQLGGGVFADFGSAGRVGGAAGADREGGAGSTGGANSGECGKERCGFDERNAEEIAGASEVLMEEYLETGSFCEESIRLAIEKRELFPVFFGSALKLEGVEEFIEALGRFTLGKECGEDFGARVYKIGRDKQGNRLTYLKVTSGTLRNKMLVDGGEKIEQIRLYSGDSFQSVQSAGAGMV
ncbi:MAG: GTP-binding protein, partial [Firmicutes bacterium]|nr:GTP-binding protein [Bacillota bacterium]